MIRFSVICLIFYIDMHLVVRINVQYTMFLWIFVLILPSFSSNICSKSVTDICECEPPATVRCLHKNLVEYPNFVVPQTLIQNLDVSNNQLTTFPRNLNRFNRLETLNLSHNRIEFIPNTILFPMNLRSLILAYNNISSWFAINSNKIFLSAISLHTLDLSGNPIRNLNENKDESLLISKSLRVLKMSHCYMDMINLEGLPNVTTVLLNVNSLTRLTPDTFGNNGKIDRLDLSSNAITHIESNTFDGMKKLTILDLSFNLIREIATDTFRNNYQLKIINLSRNTIERFRRFTSYSLTSLNLSSCEVLTIDNDALNEMPQLVDLDLSRNFINEFPSGLKSPLLQILDLSQCRLSKIENNTFFHFDELSRLNLAGNRLTTTFHIEYFTNNLYLNEIWIADNPWHCECIDKSFKEFYHFILKKEIVKDRSQLRCFSPKSAYDEKWESACYRDWYANQKQPDVLSRLWTITMVFLVNVTILYCAISGFKRWISYRREVEEEQWRRNNLETSRELMRHNQMVLEQESQLNAPDPRETHPPCYEDAIRLPRLIRSTISLKRVDLVSHSINSRTRSRSEGNVGGRSSFAIKNASEHFNKRKPNGRNGCYKVKSKNGISSQSVIEVIDQLETVNGHSPYSKRKFDSDIEIATYIPSTSKHIYASDESIKIVMRDNHYRSENHLSEMKPLSECSYSSFTSTSDSSFDSMDFCKMNRE